MAKVEDLYVGCPVELYLNESGFISKSITKHIVSAYIESVLIDRPLIRLGIGWYCKPEGVKHVVGNRDCQFPYIYASYVEMDSIIDVIESSPDIKCECCNKAAPHLVSFTLSEYICDMCRTIYELNVEKIK